MPRFLIFIPAWMAEDTVAMALASALEQDYSPDHFRVVCVVDGSADGTWTAARSVLDFARGNIERVAPAPGDDLARYLSGFHPRHSEGHVLLVNPQRIGVVGNTWNVCHHFAGADEIVVQLDGDDQLADPYVLSSLADVYAGRSLGVRCASCGLDHTMGGCEMFVAPESEDVWMTYGSYADDEASRKPDGSDPRGLSCLVPAEDHTRRSGWRSSHLRTWKAWLFCKIRRADLLEPLGAWIDAAPDLATMWPMIEMAGPVHARYIHDILYLYNGTNPLSESRSKPLQARAVRDWLQAQPPYRPLRDRADSPRREDVRAAAFERHFGEVDLGRPIGADNEGIDRDLGAEAGGRA